MGLNATHLFYNKLLILIAFFCAEVFAIDEVILRRVPGIYANPDNYTMTVLRSALETTVGEYGPYSLAYATQEMSRMRTFNEMQSGSKVNVMETPISEAWSNTMIRIPVPVQRGILSYRLFLVSKENIDILKDVKTIEELKSIRLGTGSQWSITNILKTHEFNIVEGTTKLSLLNMLCADRFSIYGRGINEIFGEVENHAKTHPKLVIEPHVAMYVYLPTYFHVSPGQNRIAERIEDGLEKINRSGLHEKLFLEHHEKAITKADLNNRRVLMVKADEMNDGRWENDLPYLFTTPEML